MNPQANDIDFNDPKIQKAFAFFQQQQQQQQMQQMLFQQQQQYIMQQQNQQLWNEFLQYCKTTGQNSNDVNLFNQYCQIKMMMNMNNMNNMNNNMNNMNNINMNNMMNNMNNMNNNILQQSLNNSTNQNQQSTYIKSEEQTPRDDSVYLKDKETIPRVKKIVYVNENELQGNSGNNFGGFSMNQNQNSFMKQFGMSSSTDIINVTLTATSGLKVVIPAQKSMSLSQLFKIYVKKVGVPESVIGTKIVFLFNAEKLDHNAQQPITNFFKAFNANITVLDQANIIGA
jgi:hypothetical protein